MLNGASAKKSPCCTIQWLGIGSGRIEQKAKGGGGGGVVAMATLSGISCSDILPCVQDLYSTNTSGRK